VNFTQNDGQRELAGLSRRILTDRLTPERLAAADAGGDRFDPALWASLAGAGILAAALPESVGGAGLGLLEQCSVLTELGRAVAPVPYLASIVLGASALARFGTPDQQRRWAAPAGRGELILTAALPEEDGDDPQVPSASAERVPGGWLLSGVKTAVFAAPLAALLLVPAATADGPAVFLVAPGDPGVTVERQQVTGGDSAGRVTLRGARLGDDRVLGRPAAGLGITEWLVAHGTVGLCALQLGVVERALELTSAYARDRVQFGRPIGSFQAVQHQLAVMAEQTCAARMAAQLAFASPQPRPDRTLAAMAKCVAGEAAAIVAAGGHAVHGAIGITAAYDLQLCTRRLLAWRTQGGSPTYWAREVGTAWWRSGETRALDFALARLADAQG
jgi:acyl-CoA dehydrogenase